VSQTFLKTIGLHHNCSARVGTTFLQEESACHVRQLGDMQQQLEQQQLPCNNLCANPSVPFLTKGLIMK
jgi:hypothetical protein